MSRSANNESYPEPDGRSGTHIPIMLSIFKLPAKGKSRGVILDEFLNAHDMIILVAPLTFV